MGLRSLTTTLLLATILILSANAFAADKSAVEYKALKIDGKVIATNGKFSYVIDPSALHDVIETAGYAQIKIYGTDIWLTLNKNGDITVRKTHLVNSSFYVLAAIKDINAPAEKSVNYATYAMGYSTSKSLQYPSSFCTGCAAPTSLDDKSKSVIKIFMTASTVTAPEDAKPVEMQTLMAKPGSS